MESARFRQSRRLTVPNMYLVLAVLLAIGIKYHEASTIITFPTSFTSSEDEKIDPLDIKNCYQKGIKAVQSVAGLVQNILLQETVDFAAQNWIISPVGLTAVFAQLLMGSRGEIREILTDALSLVHNEKNLEKLEVHRQLGDLMKRLQRPASDDYTLLFNSAVFLQAGFPLKTTYKHALWDFYNTQIVSVDFTSESFEDRPDIPIDLVLGNPLRGCSDISLRGYPNLHVKNSSASIDTINRWVKNSTQNRFSDLISLSLSPNIISIMANIVYFKGFWEIPFDQEYTQPGLFYIDEKTKERVDYMYGEQNVLYGNSSDFQLIGIPYKSREVVIYILLPNRKFSARNAMKQFDDLASSAKLENVTLVLPKIKMTTTISVKDAIAKYLKKSRQSRSGQLNRKYNRNFKRLKEPEAFGNSSVPVGIASSLAKARRNDFDMGGASEDVRFKIDDILHKVTMQIDELGTELVAATSTLVDHSGDDFVLRVNRPFLFFVRHEMTMAHLFWGFVNNPNQVTTIQKPAVNL